METITIYVPTNRSTDDSLSSWNGQRWVDMGSLNKTKGYFFTPSELSDLKQKVAGEAWDASRDYFLHLKDLGDLGIECSLPNKTEYLKSLKG